MRVRVRIERSGFALAVRIARCYPAAALSSGSPEPSLAFDPAGLPWVSYRSGMHLYVARFDGTGWLAEQIEDGQPRSTGYGNSLAFAADGHPSVSFHTVSGSLKLARHDGLVWRYEDLTRQAAFGTSLAFAPSGHEAIAYYDGGDLALKLARWDGTAWAWDTIDASPVWRRRSASTERTRWWRTATGTVSRRVSPAMTVRRGATRSSTARCRRSTSSRSASVRPATSRSPTTVCEPVRSSGPDAGARGSL